MKPLILVALASFWLAVSGSGGRALAESPVEPLSLRVGVLQSLTGAGSVYGVSATRGIELAIQELNAAGSEPRFVISYSVLDDHSNVATGRQAVNTFADQHVTAVVGPTLSNVAPGVFEAAQDASIIAISPTTTAAGITSAGEYAFRVALGEEVVVPAAIAYANQQAPINRAALFLDSTDAFSRSSSDAMRKGIDAIGATIEVEIDISETDINAAIADLSGQQIDVLLVTPLLDEAVAILKALHSAGLEQPIIGGNSFNSLEIAQLAGEAAEGVYVGAAWNPASSFAASLRFVESYTLAYGEAPDQYAAQGYATVQLLADAARRANSSVPELVRLALAGTRNLVTPLGEVSFSAQRDGVYPALVQQFRNGELAVVQ